MLWLRICSVMTGTKSESETNNYIVISVWVILQYPEWPIHEGGCRQWYCGYIPTHLPKFIKKTMIVDRKGERERRMVRYSDSETTNKKANLQYRGEADVGEEGRYI